LTTPHTFSWNKRLAEIVEGVMPFIKAANTIAQRIGNFLHENPDFLERLRFFFENWPAKLKEAWTKAAQQGWYISKEVPLGAIGPVYEGGKVLDDYMMAYIDENWCELTAKLLALHPKRAHIFEVAFRLHKEETHIASIPLFFSQADGICAQHLKAYLFTEHDKRAQNVKKLIAESGDDNLGIFLSALTVDTQIGANIASASPKKKALGPNRSGILHGSRKHLDYGTPLNGYKAFSLLCFVAFCFDEDIIPKNVRGEPAKIPAIKNSTNTDDNHA
jgi:hypothetical protein